MGKIQWYVGASDEFLWTFLSHGACGAMECGSKAGVLDNPEGPTCPFHPFPPDQLFEPWARGQLHSIVSPSNHARSVWRINPLEPAHLFMSVCRGYLPAVRDLPTFGTSLLSLPKLAKPPLGYRPWQKRPWIDKILTASYVRVAFCLPPRVEHILT